NTTIGGAGTLTLSGVVDDAASSFSLSKVGAGTLILGNANTFDGGVTLTTGNLSGGNNTAFGTDTVTLTGGKLIANSAGLNFGNAISLGASANIGGSNDFTLSGVV